MIKFTPENGMRTYIDEQLAQFGFQYDDSLTDLPPRLDTTLS